jgi:uncharacterized protein
MTNRYQFGWDPRKALTNIQKHHIAFDEAATVFMDPLALTTIDDDHAEIEDRWVTIGTSARSRLVLVVHTQIDIATDFAYIRIISARRPSRSELRQYNEGSR